MLHKIRIFSKNISKEEPEEEEILEVPPIEEPDEIVDPGPPELWKHQKEAIERASKLNYFGFLFEPGLGKTRTVIETCEHRYSELGRVLKTIILAPPVVIENFRREFEKFGKLSKQKVITLQGGMENRVKKFNQIQNGNFIVITNYEVLYNKKLYDLLMRWKPEIFIADEMHKLKNIKSQRTKAAIRLADVTAYRYGLSGTPILNSQMDIFSQVRVLDGGATFGTNFKIFLTQYFYNANASRVNELKYFPLWLPKPGINEIIQAKIAPFTMSAKKSEALDLPPLLVKEYVVEMGKNQEVCYEQMKKDFVAFIRDEACVAELAVTKSLRLQQIVSGYIKTEGESEYVFEDVPKLTALTQILDDVTPNHKVIVWCAFKKNYDMIKSQCNVLKIKTAQLTGDTSNKQAEIDAFQDDPEVRVMIANPGAGGIGINLTAASYMIYYSKTFNLEHQIQSEARNYRGGSEVHEKITRIDLVCKGTIDDVISQALEKKKFTGDAILDNKFILTQLRKAFDGYPRKTD